MSNKYRVVNYSEFDAHLSSRVKTFSRVFTIYIIRDGLQDILGSCTDPEQVVPLCKKFSVELPFHSKIFVSEDFHSNCIRQFKL